MASQQNENVVQGGLFDSFELQQRRRYVGIKEYPKSQLPFRLERKRDGVVLGACETEQEALQTLSQLPENAYNPIRTKGKHR